MTLVRDDLEKEVERTVEVSEGCSVEELFEKEGIPSEEVLAALDNTVVSKQRSLKDGDRLRVFDVVAGG